MSVDSFRRLAARVDQWHWLILALAAPFLLFPGADARLAALAVVALLWLSAWVARGEPFPVTPFNRALLLFELMLLVSLFATFSLEASLGKLAGVILGLAVLRAFAAYGRSARGWWLCLLAFIATGSGIAIAGVFLTQWASKVAFLAPITTRLVPRILGIPGIEEGLNPNQLAGALTWVLPLLVCLSALVLWRGGELTRDVDRWTRVLVLAAVPGSAALVAAVFLLSQSRSGYIGIALTCLLAPLALPGRWRRAYSLVMAVLAPIACFYLWQAGFDRVLGAIFNGDQGAALPFNNTEGRLEMWTRALWAIQDFPLTGLGLNTTRTVFPVFYPLFTAEPDVFIPHVHNEFLQAAVDLGLPGLAAFVALQVGALTMLWRVWQRAPGVSTGWLSHHGVVRALALGLAGGLLAHDGFGLTDAVSLGAKPGILFWMLLGLVVGLYGLQDRRMDSEPPADGPGEASILGVE